ncbi:MAG TPA: hypothetical protein VER03_20465, partial [Bryobacteraceae bacterium]|nr:hypothetical protein [Bryobacteraceae bacterium]
NVTSNPELARAAVAAMPAKPPPATITLGIYTRLARWNRYALTMATARTAAEGQRNPQNDEGKQYKRAVGEVHAGDGFVPVWRITNSTAT